MPLLYRTLLDVDKHEDVHVLLDREFRSWLASKERKHRKDADGGWREWTTEGYSRLSATDAVSIVHDDNHHGMVLARYSLTEHNDTGTWVVTASARSRADSGNLEQTFWLTVSGPAGNHAPQPPSFLASLLLEPVFHSHGTPVSGVPIILDEADLHRIPELVEHLQDPDRLVNISLAGPLDDTTPVQWIDITRQAFAASVGLSTVYVLDRAACDALNGRLADNLRVPDGGIRTFLPGALLDDEDSTRHPVLGPGTIYEHIHDSSRGKRLDRRLGDSIARNARRRMLSVPLPGVLVRASRRLDEMAVEARIEARAHEVAEAQEAAPAEERGGVAAAAPVRTTVPAPAVPTAPPAAIPAPRANVPAPDVSLSLPTESDIESTVPAPVPAAPARHLAGMLTAVRKFLHAIVGGHDEPTPESLDVVQELWTEQQRTLDELQTAKDAQDETVLELDSEIRDLTRKVAKLEATQRYHQRKLAELGHHDDAYAPDLTTELVDLESYEDLLTWLHGGSPQSRQLQHVVFTGSDDAVEELADRDTECAALSRICSALIALDDYATTRLEDDRVIGFAQYIKETPQGRQGCAAQSYAARESETVEHNKKLRNERVLPVPRSVDPSGSTFMESHLKISAGSAYPRIYFLDDVQNSGTVYVGYIGKHLTNTKTN